MPSSGRDYIHHVTRVLSLIRDTRDKTLLVSKKICKNIVWTPMLELSVGSSAIRWSKGSLGFRVDREVMINLVTQLSMRV